MRRFIKDERGGALVFAALALAFLLSAGALAVDAGSLYTAKGDAQKAAAAAALAGASVFIDQGSASEARARAEDYALMNSIHGERIRSDEVRVTVISDSATPGRGAVVRARDRAE